MWSAKVPTAGPRPCQRFPNAAVAESLDWRLQAALDHFGRAAGHGNMWDT
jgi:hypothetical protein